MLTTGARADRYWPAVPASFKDEEDSDDEGGDVALGVRTSFVDEKTSAVHAIGVLFQTAPASVLQSVSLSLLCGAVDGALTSDRQTYPACAGHRGAARVVPA
jgi:hypothetical protein